jgi:lycopene beta-cyclase
LVEPLVVARWDGYQVRFPGLHRHVPGTYASVSSERLHHVVSGAVRGSPGSVLRLESEAREVAPGQVTLSTGERLQATLVVDARGPDRHAPGRVAGYQKFLGLELSLRAPVPDGVPCLMDACVPQVDGYRFVYTLPLAPDRVLVEDTYFSDTPALDVGAMRAFLLSYAAEQGMEVSGTLRQETGVLPLPARATLPEPTGVLVAGYQGGWFHPTTGYSFPLAARLALHVAHTPVADLSGPPWRAFTRGHRQRLAFCAMLNRVLFHATPPAERWKVFQRFHRMDPSTIRRFYALEMTPADFARILWPGPPPGAPWRAALEEALHP